MNNTQLHIQQSTYSLKRFPNNQFDKSLRAWDAADEYIIDQVCEQYTLSELQRIIIVNDSFGALTCAMSRLAPQAQIYVYTDSFMARCGIEQNLKGSNLDKNNVRIIDSLEFYEIESQCLDSMPCDLILLKVPRTQAYLKYLLATINRTFSSTERSSTERSSTVRSNEQKLPNMISGAMIKLVTSSVVKAFEYAMQDVKTSLARKKSRLIYSHIATHKSPSENTIKIINEPSIPFGLYNYPNVFCRDQIDIGARYLLKNLPTVDNDPLTIIDLGCGNGILGTYLLMLASQEKKSLKVIYVDESYMAIASAKESLLNSTVSQENKDKAEFIVSHSLSTYLTSGDTKVDMVLCNPPFHQQSTIIDDIAWQMFLDAKRVLKIGGELRIVGNRHLEHRAKLSKLFGGCKVIASDKKFVVLSSIKES